MKYIQEVNAFYDWLETNSMAVSSVALWHALVHICNKTGWSREFAVAVSVLSAKTGLERRTIYNARNELKQKGRLDFRERKGNQCAIYMLNFFSNECENSGTNFAHNLSRSDLENDCCTKFSHNASHNVSHNTSHSPSHNVSPLIDLTNSNILHSKKIRFKRSFKDLDPTKKKDPAIKRLIDKYHSLFVEKFSDKPVIDGGKAGKIFKTLLTKVSEKELTSYLEAFFKSQDQFIADSGYDIGVFKIKINSFIAKKGGGKSHASGTSRGHIDKDPIPISNLIIRDTGDQGPIDVSDLPDLP
jgi:hypothetical protein